MRKTQSESITRLIDSASEGDAEAARRLWESAYSDVHRLAAAHLSRERSDSQLQPTMLVHEAFLRIWPKNGPNPKWDDRRQFFGNVARVMGQYLTDFARARMTSKRGGDLDRIPLELAEGECAQLDVATSFEGFTLLTTLGDFERHSPRAAEVVWLRFVMGLSIAQSAVALGVSERTIVDDWKFARAWLRRHLSSVQEEGD